jgi:hypothetical protein
MDAWIILYSGGLGLNVSKVATLGECWCMLRSTDERAIIKTRATDT